MEIRNGILDEPKKSLESLKTFKNPIKKKITKRKLHTKKNNKINSKKQNFNQKNHQQTETIKHNHISEKKIDSNDFYNILKNLASDPERL